MWSHRTWFEGGFQRCCRPQAAAGDKTHRSSSSYLSAEITSCIYAQQVFPESDLTEAGLIGGNGINSKNRDGVLKPGSGNKNMTDIWAVDH